MECSNIRRSLSAYLDGELKGGEAAQIRAHLAKCSSCRAELHFLERLSAATTEAFSQAPFDKGLVNRTFVKIKEREAIAKRSFAFGKLVFAAASVLAAVAIVLLASNYVSDTGRGGPAALAVGTGGSAFVRHAGSSAWRKLGLGDRLYSGDVLKNASTGFVSLRTPGGSKLVLNHDTSVQMGADPPTATCELISGEVFVEVNNEPFRILCDGATVTVNGTSFSVRKDFGKAVVTVLKGLVTCASGRVQVKIGAGQQSVALAGRAPSEPVSIDTTRALNWRLRAAAASVTPAASVPPAVRRPAPWIPVGAGGDLPYDQPLEPPKRRDK